MSHTHDPVPCPREAPRRSLPALACERHRLDIGQVSVDVEIQKTRAGRPFRVAMAGPSNGAIAALIADAEELISFLVGIGIPPTTMAHSIARTVGYSGMEEPASVIGAVLDLLARKISYQSRSTKLQRAKLPTRRRLDRFHMRLGNGSEAYEAPTVYLDIGQVDDRPAEVFISGPPSGSDLGALAQDAAVLISIALQYGVTPRKLRNAITAPACACGTAGHGCGSGYSSLIALVIDQLFQFTSQEQAA